MMVPRGHVLSPPFAIASCVHIKQQRAVIIHEPFWAMRRTVKILSPGC